MSAASKKNFNYSVVLSGDTDYIEKAGFGDYNAAATKAREVSYHTTEHRIVVKANSVDERLAYVSDLNKFGSYRGSFDASGGIVPTTAVLTAALGDQAEGTPINAGDEILISVAGTIPGLFSGSTSLEVGDVLKSIKDGATVAADFIAIERNQPTVAALQEETVTGVDLVADTAFPLTFTTTFTKLKSWVVLDSSNNDITSQILVTRTAPGALSLTSSVVLTGLTVEVIGLG